MIESKAARSPMAPLNVSGIGPLKRPWQFEVMRLGSHVMAGLMKPRNNGSCIGRRCSCSRRRTKGNRWSPSRRWRAGAPSLPPPPSNLCYHGGFGWSMGRRLKHGHRRFEPWRTPHPRRWTELQVSISTESNPCVLGGRRPMPWRRACVEPMLPKFASQPRPVLAWIVPDHLDATS